MTPSVLGTAATACLLSISTLACIPGYATAGTRHQVSGSFLGDNFQGRALQQAGAATSKNVADAAGLLAALKEGLVDIVLTKHIDLSTLPQNGKNMGLPLPEVPPGKNLTVRGNCDGSTPTPGVPADVAEISLDLNACVIVTTGPVIAIGGNVWLENLVLRFNAADPTAAPAAAGSLVTVTEQGRLWAFDMAFEGDGFTSLQGAVVNPGAKAFFKNCFFRHLGGTLNPLTVSSPTSLSSCTFTANFKIAGSAGLPLALIEVLGTVSPDGSGPALRMEAGRYINNDFEFTVRAADVQASERVYSDYSIKVLVAGPDYSSTGASEILASNGLQEIEFQVQSEQIFISERSPWLIDQGKTLPALRPPGEPADPFEIAADEVLAGGGDSAAAPAPGPASPGSVPPEVLPPMIVKVKSAAMLMAAVAEGARDIVIAAHIDLLDQPVDDLGFIFALQPTTRSIRGQCTEQTAMPVEIRTVGPLKSQQCVLSAPNGIFRTTHADQLLWLDHLYLHTAPSVRSDFEQEHRLMDIDGQDTMVWVSNCTLQGDADYSEAVMLWSETAAIHFEDCTIDNFDVPLNSRAVVTSWGVLSVVNAAISNLNALEKDQGVFFADDTGTITLLRSGHCKSCEGNQYMVEDGGLIYVDPETQSQVGNKTVWNASRKVQVAPERIPEGQKPRGTLTMNHPWLLAVQTSLTEADLAEAAIPGGGGAPSQPGVAPQQQVVTASPPDIDFVTNAGGLVNAINKGNKDIVLTNHIDLRGVDLNEFGYSLAVLHTTRSILGGACFGAVPPEMLSEGDRDWARLVTSGQCIILADAGLFFLADPNHNIWIDSLFIRFVGTAVADDSDTAAANDGDEASGDPRAIVVARQGSTVYGSNLSFQVAKRSRMGGFQVAALWSDQSRVHLEDPEIYDFSVDRGQPAIISTWGPFSMTDALLVRCSAGEGMALFHTENFGTMRVQNLASIEVTGTMFMTPGPLEAGQDGTTLSTGFYCDSPNLQVQLKLLDRAEPCTPLDEIPEPMSFASLDDSWWLALLDSLAPVVDSVDTAAEQVAQAAEQGPERPPDLPPATPAGKPGATTEGTPGGDSTASSTAADQAAVNAAAPESGGGDSGHGTRIALIAVLGTLLPLVLVALAVWMVHRRHSKKEDWEELDDGMHGIHGTKGAVEHGTSNGTIPADAADVSWSDGGTSAGGPMQPLRVISSTGTPGESLNRLPLEALGPNPRGGLFPTAGGAAGKDPTTLVTPLAPLTLALDALCSNRGRFLDKYTPLGLAHRRLGRTAVVQIFEDAETSRRYAVKFYRSRTSFDCERAAYNRTTVADAIAVPQHGLVTEPGIGPDGYRWPPCIVMDVGEPLDAFIARVPRGDEPTMRVALADVAAVVEVLHSKGWAHRNLKPSNVLFLAETERWVLCDLERCGRVGQTSPACPPCEFTALEVWAAMQTAQPQTVTAAADVWAIGGIMFEAVTGERVQEPGMSARAAAKGLRDRAEAAGAAGTLGVLRDVVLDCLSIAPAARPTIRSIVPLLQAEVIEAKQHFDLVLEQLQALADEVQDYEGFCGYLEAIRVCTIIPEATRSRLPEPPAEDPGHKAVRKVAKEYCMALGPDNVTFAKGIALRDDRLQAFRIMNSHINEILRHFLSPPATSP